MQETDGSDWERIREAYCNATLPVRDICVRFRVSRTALYDRIKAEDWPRRKNGKYLQQAQSFVEKTLEDNEGEHPARLVPRLFQALERQLIASEQSPAASATDAGAAEQERHARTLASLVRTLEKLIDLHEAGEDEETAAQENDENAEGLNQSDADSWRKELAQRIARFSRDGKR